MARHITVAGDMKVSTGTIKVTGNIWVRGSGLLGGNAIFRGDMHTFARNDSSDKGAFIAGRHHAHVNKHDGGSVELLGHWGVDDSSQVNSGTMIIGPNSLFSAGNRHDNLVSPKGTLVLMSGATFQVHSGGEGNKIYDDDLEVFGALLAGTPERPLTEDAVLGLSFKGHGKVDRFPWSRPGDRGLVVHPDGRIAVHSADPKKARLVFRWHGIPFRAVTGIPQKIDMRLLGTTEFNGVEFNDVGIGGIELARPEVRKQWKNIFYGQGNAGAPDELYAFREGAGVP